MGNMSELDLPEDAIRIVEHTADWALRVRGGDLAELFGRAAVGMARLLAGDLADVPLEEARELALPLDWQPQGLITAGYPAEERTKTRASLETRVKRVVSG